MSNIGGGLCPPNLNIGGAGAPSPPPCSYAPPIMGHLVFQPPSGPQLIQMIQVRWLKVNLYSLKVGQWVVILWKEVFGQVLRPD